MSPSLQWLLIFHILACALLTSATFNFPYSGFTMSSTCTLSDTCANTSVLVSCSPQQNLYGLCANVSIRASTTGIFTITNHPILYFLSTPAGNPYTRLPTLCSLSLATLGGPWHAGIYLYTDPSTSELGVGFVEGSFILDHASDTQNGCLLSMVAYFPGSLVGLSSSQFTLGNNFIYPNSAPYYFDVQGYENFYMRNPAPIIINHNSSSNEFNVSCGPQTFSGECLSADCTFSQRNLSWSVSNLCIASPINASCGPLLQDYSAILTYGCYNWSSATDLFGFSNSPQFNFDWTVSTSNSSLNSCVLKKATSSIWNPASSVLSNHLLGVCDPYFSRHETPEPTLSPTISSAYSFSQDDTLNMYSLSSALLAVYVCIISVLVLWGFLFLLSLLQRRKFAYAPHDIERLKLSNLTRFQRFLRALNTGSFVNETIFALGIIINGGFVQNPCTWNYQASYCHVVVQQTCNPVSATAHPFTFSTPFGHYNSSNGATSNLVTQGKSQQITLPYNAFATAFKGPVVLEAYPLCNYTQVPVCENGQGLAAAGLFSGEYVFAPPQNLLKTNVNDSCSVFIIEVGTVVSLIVCVTYVCILGIIMVGMISEYSIRIPVFNISIYPISTGVEAATGNSLDGVSVRLNPVILGLLGMSTLAYSGVQLYVYVVTQQNYDYQAFTIAVSGSSILASMPLWVKACNTLDPEDRYLRPTPAPSGVLAGLDKLEEG